MGKQQAAEASSYVLPPPRPPATPANSRGSKREREEDSGKGASKFHLIFPMVLGPSSGVNRKVKESKRLEHDKVFQMQAVWAYDQRLPRPFLTRCGVADGASHFLICKGSGPFCCAQAVPRGERYSGSKLASQLDQHAFMSGGRLRIPSGNGYVTLPAMSGIG